MSGSTEWLGTTGGCENRRGGAPTTCLRGRFARALGERSGNSDSAISRGGVLGSVQTQAEWIDCRGAVWITRKAERGPRREGFGGRR
jgi:hypothetical protein